MLNINKIRRSLLTSPNGLIYINNPKCGCSTIKQTMLGYKVQGNLHPTAHRELKFRKYNNETIFTVTRNPFSRVLSAYRDKIIRPDPNVYLKFCKQYNLAENSKISFSQFLEIIATESNQNLLDSHFRPQYLNLYRSHITPAFTGRLERMEDVDVFLNSFGLNLLSRRIFTNEGGTKSSKDYRAIIANNEESLITTIYKKDFEIYGYDQDLQSLHIPPTLQLNQPLCVNVRLHQLILR